MRIHQGWIKKLNEHESIAVRSIARRICGDQDWVWQEVKEQAKEPVILISESLRAPADFEEASMLIDQGIAKAYRIYGFIFAILEGAGLDGSELSSEFYRFFQEIEKGYSWADNERLKRWSRMILARRYRYTDTIIGREAAMRVVGKRALSGQIPPGAEISYDMFCPIYDPELEMHEPGERPVEMRAMEWSFGDDTESFWYQGKGADSWSDYPDKIDELHIIGERTWLIRPEWAWPREERRRGIVIGTFDSTPTHNILETSTAITFERYLAGSGQKDRQLIVLNAERDLVGPSYRWAAINSSFATKLGWFPSKNTPFMWVDAEGNLMVKSIFWRDGWIWIEPPRFESLGEGWLVLASGEGFNAIRSAFDNVELHLWVERHSHGDKQFEGKWHLSKNIS